MQKAILVLFLVAVSSSVTAEWVGIGENKEFKVYVDPDTLRKSGNKAKMWCLHDYKTARAAPYSTLLFISSKIQYEFDCMEVQSRLLYLSTHSENMGGGDVVEMGNDPSNNWIPVSPDSVNEIEWRFACET